VRTANSSCGQPDSRVDEMEWPAGSGLRHVRLGGRLFTLGKQLGMGACSRGVVAAQGGEGEPVALKIFPQGKRANYYNTLSKYNHYCQTRDVSQTGYDEIRALQADHPFLPKFIARECVEGAWILVMELVPGVDFQEFIKMHGGDVPLLVAACRTLGATLRQWHEAGFAHGDPNLGNALIDAAPGCEPQVKLVDLNMLHHAGFSCCQIFGCDHRYTEDLTNADRKIGPGFVQELREIQAHRTGLPDLAAAFLEGHDGCSRCR
jgi:serine/threonine protein kinase